MNRIPYVIDNIAVKLADVLNKANRKTQDSFLCVRCGFSGLADHIAAGNISRRAEVNRPNVSTAQTTVQRQGQSPCL